MRILKPYASRELREKLAYSENSPLIREIKARYDYTDVVFGPEMTEEEKAAIIREYDVVMTMWCSPRIPDCLAENPGKLKYICNITGEMTKWISYELVASPNLVVTNWGDAPAYDVAEGAFALLMSVLRDIPVFLRGAREKHFGAPTGVRTGSLLNTRVGIFGMGVIGRKFVEFLRPFQPRIYAYDPYVSRMPEGVMAVDSLEELCSTAKILVIHAGLTDRTRGVISGDLLARLPDGGVLINTARGAIVDQQALERELVSGRLRAGLDVMYPSDMPPEDSPLRNLDNCILTAHAIGTITWGRSPEDLDMASRNCLDNLERFAAGAELNFIMTPERYQRST